MAPGRPAQPGPPPLPPRSVSPPSLPPAYTPLLGEETVIEADKLEVPGDLAPEQPPRPPDAFHMTDTRIFRMTAAELDRIRGARGEAPLPRTPTAKLRKLRSDVQPLHGADREGESPLPADELAQQVLDQLARPSTTAPSAPPELHLASINFEEEAPPATLLELSPDLAAEEAPAHAAAGLPESAPFGPDELPRQTGAGTAKFFDLVDPPPGPPASPRRRCAALEVNRGRVRYLEFVPQGEGLAVARFEQVEISRAHGMRFSDHVPNVSRALAELRERLGASIPPCTVLLEQDYVVPSVIVLPASSTPDAIRAAVERQVKTVSHLPAEENLVDSVVLGHVKVGDDVQKPVLVAFTARSHVKLLLDVLSEARFPVARVTSSHVAFLESLVVGASNAHEDSAEAFIYVDDPVVTIALAARGRVLLTRNFRLRQYDDIDEFLALVYQLSLQLKRTGLYFQRTCGGGHISRIHYLSAVEHRVPFSLDALSKSFQRPADQIEVVDLFRIDPASVGACSVPPSVLAAMTAAAVAAPPRARDVINLLPEGVKLRTVRVLAWLAVAALLVALGAIAYALDRRAVEALEPSLAMLRAQEAEIDRARPLAAELPRIEAMRARVERESEVLRGIMGLQPDLRQVLLDLARVKPPEVYVESLSVSRTRSSGGSGFGVRSLFGIATIAETPSERWSLDLSAVAVAEGARAERAAGELVQRLAAAPFLHVDEHESSSESSRPVNLLSELTEYPVKLQATLLFGER